MYTPSAYMLLLRCKSYHSSVFCFILYSKEFGGIDCVATDNGICIFWSQKLVPICMARKDNRSTYLGHIMSIYVNGWRMEVV